MPCQSKCVCHIDVYVNETFTHEESMCVPVGGVEEGCRMVVRVMLSEVGWRTSKRKKCFNTVDEAPGSTEVRKRRATLTEKEATPKWEEG